MANKMPPTTPADPVFSKVRAQAQKAADRGPNPDDLTQGRMKGPGVARFAGTFTTSKGPIAPGDQQGSKLFHLPSKPISTQKGQPAKEVG